MASLVIYATIHVIVLMVPHVFQATVLAPMANAKPAGLALTVDKVSNSSIYQV